MDEPNKQEEITIDSFLVNPRLTKTCNWLWNTLVKPLDEGWDRLFKKSIKSLERGAGLPPEE